MDGIAQALAAAKKNGDLEGIDPDVANKKAAQIWSMLDDMSANDPRAYKRFIEHQTEMERRSRERHFVPAPGFAFRAVDKTEGEIVYANCACHKALQPPLTNTGQPVCDADGKDLVTLPGDLAGAGLQIPLTLSEAREWEGPDGEEALVVDVLFHPWLLKKCQLVANAAFKLSVVELALIWLEEELGLKLSRAYKMVTETDYVDAYEGMGERECRPYFVSEAEVSGGDDEEAMRKAAKDRADRNKARQKARRERRSAKAEESGDGAGAASAAGGGRLKGKARKAARMGGEGGIPSPSDLLSGGRAGGGASAGAGGGAAAMAGGHDGTGDEGSVMSSPSSLLQQLHLGGSAAGASGAGSGPVAKPEGGGPLISEVAADGSSGGAAARIAAAALAGARAVGAEATPAGKGKGNGNGKGKKGSAASQTRAPPAPAPAEAAATSAAKPKPRPMIEEVLETPEHTVTVGDDGAVTVIVKLPGFQSIRGVDLDVEARTLSLVAPGKYRLKATLPKVVRHAAAKAKFSKKRCTLTVVVPPATL